MDLELTGKRAIVTGGSSGLGKSIARELAREGVRVAIVARTVERLQNAAAELKNQTGADVVAVTCDTGKDQDVRAMVSTVVDHLGGVDILINAAGQTSGGAPSPRLADIDDSIFWPDVNVKVMGYIRCIREVAPHMASQGRGRIVSIGGLAARSTGSAVRSIRNVAVAAMTKNFTDELGPSGISLCVVHPGMVRTERTAAAVQKRAAREGVTPNEIERRSAQAYAIGRLVNAEEVAWVVTFLASPRAIAINGDAVVTSGGSLGSIYY